MKLAIQFSIGVYLLAAALRAGGFAPQSGSLQMTAVGAVFLCGIAVTFALDFQRGTKGYAILVGIVAATAVAFLTNQVAMPSSIFAVPQFTGFTAPDISAAFAREHVVRILIMLYVLVVDVVATLETVSDNCKALQNKDGTPLNFKRGLFFSGVTSTLGPLLGICPFIPLFETLAGVFSGGTTWRVSAVAATGFIVTVVMTPIAAIVPAAASAVALAFIGLSISKVAWKTFESEEMSGRYDRVIRYLLVGSVIGVLYVGSIAVAVLLTAAIYPIAMLKSKQSPRPSDWIVAVVCLALLSLN
jgi:AGZA family xanthine/uracil permease-like MFS transporter